jgi:hypothetical protein
MAGDGGAHGARADHRRMLNSIGHNELCSLGEWIADPARQGGRQHGAEGNASPLGCVAAPVPEFSLVQDSVCHPAVLVSLRMCQPDRVHKKTPPEERGLGRNFSVVQRTSLIVASVARRCLPVPSPWPW